MVRTPSRSAWLGREKRPGYLAIFAGLILVVSGINTGSIFLKALYFVNDHIGSSIGSGGDFVLQLMIVAITFLVGLGGLTVMVGGLLLLGKHGSVGRFLIGLGGGTAIFGEIFSLAGTLYYGGYTAPIFQGEFFALYWIGAILATASILLSRRVPATKPII